MSLMTFRLITKKHGILKGKCSTNQRENQNKKKIHWDLSLLSIGITLPNNYWITFHEKRVKKRENDDAEFRRI